MDLPLHAVPEQQGDQLDGGAVLLSRRRRAGAGEGPHRGGGARRGGRGGRRGCRGGQGELPRRAPKGEGAEGEGAEGTKPVKKSAAQEKQETLYEVMGFMRDVRKRQEKTDAMFEPLTATVALLKTYGISVSEEILRQLEEAPLAWSGMKKKVLNVREKLSLMQQLEARKIREASDAFGAKVEKFRETFLAIAPTTVKGAKIATDDVAPAYEILDHFHHGVEDKTFVYGSLSTIAAQAKALNEKQELFELHVSEYIQLKRSAEDLEFLKMLWDTASR